MPRRKLRLQPILGIWALVKRDFRRLWIDRVRILAGVGQPLLYLFLLGSGLSASSRMGGHYQSYIFPGVLGLSLLFTATFSGISIVWDRETGFFKAVLVAPISRRAIAIGKVLSGALQALAQGGVILFFAPFVNVRLNAVSLLLIVGAMTVAAVTFSAIGVAIASRVRSTEVFPVVINGFLLPMFFASGALYPLDEAPAWLQQMASLDPVGYAVDLMRVALGHPHHFHPLLSLAVLMGLSLGLTHFAIRSFECGEDL